MKTVTTAERYLVVARYQRSTDNIAVGTKGFVLFVATGGAVAVVVRDRSGRVRLRPETIDKLASFRIVRVAEAACPPAAWPWAQPTHARCDELLSRCRDLRVRVLNPTASGADE